MTSNKPFKLALVIVDFQEDFCPPNGSLAVAEGRDIAPVVNELLGMPFDLKICTKDWHPRDHVSFASNHPPPNNKPFETIVTISNPHNPSETETTRLWPDHCIQGTHGAELVPELDVAKVQHIIKKGQDKRVEMYSAFYDPFRNPTVSQSGLAQLLKQEEISHVYVVGLAMDYCVKYTAIDAAKEGFQTFLVKEGTRAVDPSGWDSVQAELEKAGVQVVGMKSKGVEMVENKT